MTLILVIRAQSGFLAVVLVVYRAMLGGDVGVLDDECRGYLYYHDICIQVTPLFDGKDASKRRLMLPSYELSPK